MSAPLVNCRVTKPSRLKKAGKGTAAVTTTMVPGLAQA